MEPWSYGRYLRPVAEDWQPELSFHIRATLLNNLDSIVLTICPIGGEHKSSVLVNVWGSTRDNLTQFVGGEMKLVNVDVPLASIWSSSLEVERRQVQCLDVGQRRRMTRYNLIHAVRGETKYTVLNVHRSWYKATSSVSKLVNVDVWLTSNWSSL